MFPAVGVELFQRLFINADTHTVRLWMIGRPAELLVGQEITSFLFDNMIIYFCRTKVKDFLRAGLFHSWEHPQPELSLQLVYPWGVAVTCGYWQGTPGDS